MMTIRILALCITAALCSGCLTTSLLTGSVARADFEGVGSFYLEPEHFEYYKKFHAQHVALGERDWPKSKIEDAQCRNAERYLKQAPAPTRPGAQSLVPLMKFARDEDCRGTDERVATDRAKKGIGYSEGLAAYNSGDYYAARVHWLPIAEYGHAGAQYYIGRMFLEGRADKYLEPCVDTTVGGKQYKPLSRGDCGFVSYGNPGSLRRKVAKEWIIKSAEHGNADAQYLLSRFASDDASNGVDWLIKAAKQGHVEAVYRLAQRYEGGVGGVPQDRAKAEELYRRAAKEGYANAQLRLATMTKENKREKQRIAWERKRQKKIAKICPNGVADFGKLLVINPYDVKGRCYGFVGEPSQILSRNTGLYKLGRKTAYIDFGRDAAPGQFFQGYVKGVGVYTYTTVMGAKMIVPSLVATELPPEEYPARAAD